MNEEDKKTEENAAPKTVSGSARRNESIGSIEADLAFFDARMALIQHQPDTAYKRAQLKTCEVMKQELQAKLEALQLQQKNRQARKQNS